MYWKSRLMPRFGVPQGSISILGPLADVRSFCEPKWTINMYADDITLYTEAETAEQAMEALGSDARLIVNLK